MSYTNADQVRHHLVIPFPIQTEIVDQAVVMAQTDYLRFYGAALEASSLRVKSVQSASPTRSDITLSSGSAILASGPVAVGSVVVASDSSLGTIYQENVDYVVDYSGAVIMAKSGGVLSDSQQLTVWLVVYHLYVAGTDYSLKADAGEIKRLSGGAIADGETVQLDYTPVYVSVTDEVIANAVTMANAMVESEVDPDRQFEVDSTLSAAATYRALDIICRASASRELASGRSNDRVAIAWLKLADDYASRSDLMLRSFRPPYTGPKNPVHS